MRYPGRRFGMLAGGQQGPRMDTHMDQGNNAVRMRGLAVGIAAMVVIVTGSNIAVQYPINDWLTWGALTYPVSFLVTDLTNRILGPGMARRGVYVGFAVAVVLSIALATWRIALASGSAFLLAQLLDIAIFDRLRRAAALTLAGAGRGVIVFEAERLGHGASTRNGGMIGSGHRLGFAALAAQL